MNELFSDVTRKEKIGEVILWIAVLPATVFAGLAAHVIAIIGNSPGCTRRMINPADSIVDRLLVVVVSNAAMGAVTVIAGTKVAPRHKEIVAITLVVLFIFYSGMIFTVVLQRESDNLDILAVVVGALAAAVAAIDVTMKLRMARVSTIPKSNQYKD